MCAVNGWRIEAKEEQHETHLQSCWGFFREKVKEEGESIISLVVFSKTSAVEGEQQQCSKLVKKSYIGSFFEGSAFICCVCVFN